jgi:hypothetical protein
LFRRPYYARVTYSYRLNPFGTKPADKPPEQRAVERRLVVVQPYRAVGSLLLLDGRCSDGHGFSLGTPNRPNAIPRDIPKAGDTVHHMLRTMESSRLSE